MVLDIGQDSKSYKEIEFIEPKDANKPKHLYLFVKILNIHNDCGSKIFNDKDQDKLINEFIKSDKFINSIYNISYFINCTKKMQNSTLTMISKPACKKEVEGAAEVKPLDQKELLFYNVADNLLPIILNQMLPQYIGEKFLTNGDIDQSKLVAFIKILAPNIVNRQEYSTYQSSTSSSIAKQPGKIVSSAELVTSDIARRER